MLTNKKLIIIILFYILLAIALAVSIKLYFDSQEPGGVSIPGGRTETTITPPPNLDDVSVVVDLVSKHILLPPGETPRIVTITSAEILKKDQPFFTYASNGDKLLVYSKKVILYNPKDDRVIDIAYIRPGDVEATGSGIPRLNE